MNRAIFIAGVLIVGVVFAAVTLADPDSRSSGPRLDPRSTSSDGARAAVLLLEGRGIDVVVGDVPRPGEVGSLVVLVDDLDEDGWMGVDRFVRRGGDLVVAAPFAPVAGRVNRTVSAPSEFGPGCTIEELASVRRIDVPVLRTFIGGDQRCLATETGSAAVVNHRGDGRVLSLGSAHMWRNDALADEHHAALVAGVGSWASPPVRVLVRGPVGTGDRSLWELVPVWVWAAIAQVAVAFVLYGLWRGMRLGPPMREPETAQFDADALVRAAAVLTERSRADGGAAASLVERWRTDLRRNTGWASDDVADLLDLVDLDDSLSQLLASSVATDFVDPLTQAALVSEARSRMSGQAPADPPDSEQLVPEQSAPQEADV